ncbi:MAG: S1 RNA-binding domain-containing protein [Caldilineaceae bacterium]
MSEEAQTTVAEIGAADAVVVPTPSIEGDMDGSENGSTEMSDEPIAVEVDGRVVKLLAVGQQIIGTVKRVTEFGAFVDIGVGRDGLVHISELSVRRVGKVADVLKEGQEITVWIKKLDRDRNRISLSMIEPGTKTIRDLEKGEIVQGSVTRILPYGAFIDIGIGRDALLHIREMSERYIAKPEDVVNVGDVIEARIIELSRRRQRVDLSMKGLRPEPEPEPTPMQATPQPAPEPEPEDESEDEFADMEILTPMEMAFKRAMEAGGVKFASNDKRNRGKKGKRGSRSLQDEIIARTLQTR